MSSGLCKYVTYVSEASMHEILSMWQKINSSIVSGESVLLCAGVTAESQGKKSFDVFE